MSLHDDLRAMGLDPKGCVLMHTSMKAIGPCPGGADGVLDSLQDYFRRGTLVLPALSWVLAESEDRLFDPRNTPACIGLLPEMFRKRPGVLRSLHPTHSVCAWGAGAADFVAGHENTHTPCARTSPWGKLYDLDGVILQVGCDLTRCTFIHGAEEWFDPDLHLADPVSFTLKMPDGTLLPTFSRPHLGTPSEQFERARPALEAAGALTYGRLGNAPVLILRARKTCDTVHRLLRENIHIFDDPV